MLQFALRILSPKWVLEFVQSAEIPEEQLLAVCTQEFRGGDPFWKHNNRARKFMMSLAEEFAQSCLLAGPRLSADERKSRTDAVNGLLSELCLDLQARGDCTDTINELQGRINDMY